MAYSGAGTGVSGDPYIITNQSELAQITAEMGAGVYWVLANDIALTGTWTALCSSGTPFLGELDGDGFEISGISVNATDYCGLFAAIGAGTVKELNLSGTIVGRDFCGVLAGLTNGSTIKNVFVTTLSMTCRDSVGGLVGSCLNATAMFGCSVGDAGNSAGTITGRGNIGGAIGYGGAGGTITSCFANSAVSSTVGGGGLNVGGFIGNCVNTVLKCFSVGSVVAYGTVGGFTGYIYSTGNCTDCGTWSTVERSGTGAGVYIGGFVGWNRAGATRCYSIGTVTIPGDSDTTYVGGFAGNSTGGVNTNCYWDKTSSGMATSNGGTGLTTAEAKDPANYSEWDFEDIWQIFRIGTDYPWLRAIIPSYIFLLSITPEEEVQSYNVAVDLFGYNLADSMSIWMERDGYSIIVGEIFDVNANTCRAIFGIEEAMPGAWTVKVADTEGVAQIPFTIGSPGDIPTPMENAAAVWAHILSDLNNPAGSAGRILKALSGGAPTTEQISEAVWEHEIGAEAEGTAGHTLANIEIDLSPIETQIEELAGGIETDFDITQALVSSEHTTTKAYIASQTTILSNMLDAIKGTGYDIAIHSLVSIRENIDTVLKRIRQQNPMLEHQITRGVVTRQGRK